MCVCLFFLSHLCKKVLRTSAQICRAKSLSQEKKRQRKRCFNLYFFACNVSPAVLLQRCQSRVLLSWCGATCVGQHLGCERQVRACFFFSGQCKNKHAFCSCPPVLFSLLCCSLLSIMFVQLLFKWLLSLHGHKCSAEFWHSRKSCKKRRREREREKEWERETGRKWKRKREKIMSARRKLAAMFWLLGEI